ncbi:MAG TPA: hypothetical protein VLL52_19295 [Anaerolineae bacterium]|nr:hypothetical protein [Anaerolineae bacterium]
MKKTVKNFSFAILFFAALGWVMMMVIGFVAAFPEGIIGLILFMAIGGLFFVALHDQWTNEEDDYYKKNVDL